MTGKQHIIIVMLGATLLLSACQDVFEHVYDDPQEEVVQKEGQLYVDASSWLHWHYVDLQVLTDSISTQGRTPTDVAYDIPLDSIGAGNSGEGVEKPCGIYTYWYDVFGEGMEKREFRDSYHTLAQPEPERWSFAVHRNNVRTNEGAVYETSFTSMDDLPESSEAFREQTFTADTWNETDVWTVSDRMLEGLIGNQGIKVNPALSSWLQMKIPPMPPTFMLNSHVFILRLKNGTYAALQLENYMSTSGIKCCLTINYRYPY
ncbi:MAG: HmuY family protein [Bacteroidaceae bacterium]|nr:HmuY family protein [Bacteroidaceae bacterium]